MIKRISVAAIGILLILGGNALAAPNDPDWELQWGMQKIGVETAWQKARGAGVVIAVIDTGSRLTHEDLSGKFVAGRDYVDNDNDADDEHGHGTHVSGIASAVSFNGKGVVGVAPDSKIMPVRVLNELGLNIVLSPELAVRTADAVRWAADHGAKVINLSLGSVLGGGPGGALGQAIRDVWEQGVVVVVAAGNDDGDPSGYEDEPALVVVATTRNDARAPYSNRSGEAMWGISAPGGAGSTFSQSGDIYSTWCCYVDAPDVDDGYEYAAGTSMAAPHVSGAAALLLSMGLSPQETVDRLLKTAKDLGTPGVDQEFGYGRLDLAAAVALAPSTGGGGGSGGGNTGGGGSKGNGSSPGSPPNAPPGSDATPAQEPSPGSEGGGEEGSGDEGSIASADPPPEDGPAGPTTNLIILAILTVGGGIYYLVHKARRSPR